MITLYLSIKLQRSSTLSSSIRIACGHFSFQLEILNNTSLFCVSLIYLSLTMNNFGKCLFSKGSITYFHVLFSFLPMRFRYMSPLWTPFFYSECNMEMTLAWGRKSRIFCWFKKAKSSSREPIFGAHFIMGSIKTGIFYFLAIFDDFFCFYFGL